MPNEPSKKISCCSCEDILWENGMRSHLMSKQERIRYINELSSNDMKLGSRQKLNALAHLMHSYFYCMDNDEKDKYVQTFINIEISSPALCGELMEIIGILYKAASDLSKLALLKFIFNYYDICIEDATAIISFCNCVRYLYCEVNIAEQQRLLYVLREIESKNKFEYVNESIDLTINTLLGERQ